jgi:hypothetical protein
MDVSDASYYIQENNDNKGSQMGHTKKIFKKNFEKYIMFIFYGMQNSIDVAMKSQIGHSKCPGMGGGGG